MRSEHLVGAFEVGEECQLPGDDRATDVSAVIFRVEVWLFPSSGRIVPMPRPIVALIEFFFNTYPFERKGKSSDSLERGADCLREGYHLGCGEIGPAHHASHQSIAFACNVEQEPRFGERGRRLHQHGRIDVRRGQQRSEIGELEIAIDGRECRRWTEPLAGPRVGRAP